MERPIDSRVLLYVVTVADEGSITRAANRKLFVAPGSVARDLRNLEKRVGYPLFIRRWGGVGLTPCGAVFVDEARKALDHSRRAADRGAAASRGETGVLRVGYTPFLDAALRADIKKTFARRMPHVDLDFRAIYCAQQIDLIFREVLDAGLILLPFKEDELSVHTIWRTPQVVAVPASSSLAAMEHLTLCQLSGQAAILLTRTVSPVLHSCILEAFREAGCVLDVIWEALTYDDMLDAIGNGLGIGFVKESTARRTRVEGVVFRPIQDIRLSIEIGIVHRREKSSQALKAFLDILADMADSEERLVPNYITA